jgi:hypothetical protein
MRSSPPLKLMGCKDADDCSPRRDTQEHFSAGIRVKRFRRTLGAVGAFLCIVVGVICIPILRQPSHNGKRIGTWITQAADATRKGRRAELREAEDAIKHFGEATLPYLQPPSQRKTSRWVQIRDGQGRLSLAGSLAPGGACATRSIESLVCKTAVRPVRLTSSLP